MAQHTVRHRDEYLPEGLVLLEHHGAVHVGSFPVGREMQERDKGRNLVGPAVRGDELIERQRPLLPPEEGEEEGVGIAATVTWRPRLPSFR